MGKRRVPARDVPAINQARLDELLQGGDMSEGDMGDLFALLRGGGTDAEQRGDQCSECAGPVYLDPERAHHFCGECSLVQFPRYHFADCYEDNERITCAPREGYKPVHHLHERLAQYHLMETSICPADWATIVERLLFERPAVLDKESVRRLLRKCNLQRYNESWLQVIHRVTKYRPPPISQGQTLMLARIFEGVQEPFRLFKLYARKNLLNYNFMLFRLLQLLGRDDALPHFPQLKTRGKWEELDRVWGLICEFHGWAHPPVDLAAFRWLRVPLGAEVWPRLEADLLKATWAALDCADEAKELHARTRGARQPGYSDRRLLREMAAVRCEQQIMRTIRQDNASRHHSAPKRPRSVRTVARALRARTTAA